MRLLASILLLAAALSGAAAADVFRRANGNDPDTLDPQKYELLSEGIILRDLFEGLTTQDADNRIVPGQAESWTVSDDGLTLTFKSFMLPHLSALALTASVRSSSSARRSPPIAW